MKAFYDESLLKIAFKHRYDELRLLWCGVLIALPGRMAWPILLKCAFSWHFKQNVCLIRYCVFWSPASGYLQVFLSLYRANREISKVCLQIVFGYVKIRVGKCKSRTGLLILFLSAATYILGIPENKYELWGYIKSIKNDSCFANNESWIMYYISLRASYSLPIGSKTISCCQTSHMRTIVTQSL